MGGSYTRTRMRVISQAFSVGFWYGLSNGENTDELLDDNEETCGQPNNNYLIWGWFIPVISNGDFRDGLMG